MRAGRLDHVGVYGREVKDLALIADALMVHDGEDWDMRGAPEQGLIEALGKAKKKAPRFAFVRTPVWDDAEPDMAAALEDFARGLGDLAQEVELEGVFDDIVQTHTTIMNANLVANLGEALEDRKTSCRERV